MTLDASLAGAALSFVVQWRAESPNRGRAHEHWGARQRRHAAAHRAFKEAVGLVAPKGPRLVVVKAPLLTPPPLPVTVTITRVAHSRGLDPADNLPASLKPLVDACAEWLGCDDRDPRVEWNFRSAMTSERVVLRARGGGTRNAYACFVRVEIAPRAV
jgi:hypothetical protein